MEFTNGQHLVFVKKNENIPDRVESKKGWLLLDELKHSKDTSNKLSEIYRNVNIKFNMSELNCRYDD
jgi:hypothetical protein